MQTNNTNVPSNNSVETFIKDGDLDSIFQKNLITKALILSSRSTNLQNSLLKAFNNSETDFSEKLISLLNSDDPIILLAISDILVNMNKGQLDVLPVLLGLLDDENKNIRNGAIVTLGHMKSNAKGSLNRLFDIVLTADPLVRCLALSSIGFIGKDNPDELDKEKLYILLLDNDKRVRERTANVISQIGTPWSDDVLQYLIVDTSKLTNLVGRRINIISSLSSEVVENSFYFIISQTTDFEMAYLFLFNFFQISHNSEYEGSKDFFSIIGRNRHGTSAIIETIERFLKINSLYMEEKLTKLIENGEGNTVQHLLTWFAMFAPDQSQYWMKILFNF